MGKGYRRKDHNAMRKAVSTKCLYCDHYRRRCPGKGKAADKCDKPGAPWQEKEEKA